MDTIKLTTIPYRSNCFQKEEIQLASTDPAGHLNLIIDRVARGSARLTLCLHPDSAKELRDALLRVYPKGEDLVVAEEPQDEALSEINEEYLITYGNGDAGLTTYDSLDPAISDARACCESAGVIHRVWKLVVEVVTETKVVTTVRR